MKEFKVGDIVFVSNPDTEYEENECAREHKNFFGTVTEVITCEDKTCVTVLFDDNMILPTEWTYLSEELSLASELKDMTLEEFTNKYNVMVNATLRKEMSK